VHTFLPEHCHPVLYTIHAIGNLRKIVFAQSLLLGIERAIVAAGNLKIISEKVVLVHASEDRILGRKIKYLDIE